MKRTHICVVSVVFIILLVGILFLIYLKRVSGEYTESANYKARVSFLKCLHTFACEYKQKNNESVFDLYHIAKENRKYLFDMRIFVPPRRPDNWKGKGVENYLESPEKFYSLCQYRLVSSDDGWWAIMEIEMGAKGKYFLMIDKEGNIRKFKNAVLPQQENAYPERNIHP